MKCGCRSVCHAAATLWMNQRGDWVMMRIMIEITMQLHATSWSPLFTVGRGIKWDREPRCPDLEFWFRADEESDNDGIESSIWMWIIIHIRIAWHRESVAAWNHIPTHDLGSRYEVEGLFGKKCLISGVKASVTTDEERRKTKFHAYIMTQSIWWRKMRDGYRLRGDGEMMSKKRIWWQRDMKASTVSDALTVPFLWFI